jgi:phosphatidate cytidylyltransferase
VAVQNSATDFATHLPSVQYLPCRWVIEKPVTYLIESFDSEAAMVHVIKFLAQRSPLEQTALLVLAVLTAASLLVAMLRRWRPQRDYGELTARINSWWVMAGVFFGALALGRRATLVFFGLLAFWALKEFLTLLKTRPADHRALALSFLAIPVQFYWAASGWYGMFIIFIPVFMFLLLPLRLALRQETTGFVASAAQIQWGLMAFVFGLSHLGYTLMLPARAEQPYADGRALVLFLFCVVELSDVLQYIWGKSLGRHAILPRVSPNKTWEGFLGGIASAVLCSLALRFLTPFTMGETLLVAALVTLAGFAGGAVMSAVKRDFGVKDFGALIPGHGGVLDRVDSLCYAAPVFFHYLWRFHY